MLKKRKRGTEQNYCHQKQAVYWWRERGTCRFVVAVDETNIALLRQNQFAVAYLDKGPHKLKVSNDCNVLSMGMRKTLDIVADGTDQEYVTENGFWGQYRMWQVK